MDIFIGGNNKFLIFNLVVEEDLLRNCFSVLNSSYFLIS
jgi:hypothetical protein